MGPSPQETYQLAGLDPRERGFSRPVDVVVQDRRYRATLRYESVRIATDPAESREDALQLLIATLHGQGYRQLKTQISFREGRYLGSRESWTEYPDPAPAPRSLLAAIRSWLMRPKAST